MATPLGPQRGGRQGDSLELIFTRVMVGLEERSSRWEWATDIFEVGSLVVEHKRKGRLH